MRRKFMAAAVTAALLAGCIMPAGTDSAYAKETTQETVAENAEYTDEAESADEPESPENAEQAESIDDAGDAGSAAAEGNTVNEENAIQEQDLNGEGNGEMAEGAAVPEEVNPSESMGDTESAGEPVLYDEITYINPLYKDVISEENLNPLPEDGAAAYAAPRYETDANAVAGQMREAMASREGVITLYYQTGQSYNPKWLEGWFDKALEETSNPREGDYLHWNIGGYRAQIAYMPYGSQWRYEYTVSVTYYTTAAQEKEFDTKLASLLNSLSHEQNSTHSVFMRICEAWQPLLSLPEPLVLYL